MRVVFLAWRDLAHPLAGGSEVLIDRLAGGLSERGHDVSLLCGGPVGPRSYRVERTGGTYGQYVRTPLRALRQHRGSDLVVDVANGLPFFSPLWRRGPSLCLVNHLHRDQWGLWFPRPVAALGRSMETTVVPALYRNQLFMAVSESTASALVGLGIRPEAIRVVHNGVDPCRAAPCGDQPTKSREPLFVALGRLVPHKRFDVLLRVWEKVRPLTGGRLVIAGEGPERDRLQAAAGPGVSLPGRISEAAKHELLAAAWVFLHPSLVEGWGLVVMEAAVHHTPTVAFDVPGLRDSVVAGEGGLLTGSEDELARAWVSLCTDGAARTALGRGAAQRADRFSWSATVDAFLGVAEEALSWRSRRMVPAGAAVPVPAARSAYTGQLDQPLARWRD